MSGSILIAGIGNIFHGDDAFGVSVVSQLADAPPENARVVEFGIRGFDLVLALLEGHALTIFVDSVQKGGPPGSVYLIEPDLGELPDASASGIFENAHGLNPCKVLSIAKSLGASLGRVLVLGCEPATLGDDTGSIGLSEPAQAAIGPAIEMIRSVIDDFNKLGKRGCIPSGKACEK